MIVEKREAAASQIAQFLNLAFNNMDAKVMVGGAVAISTTKWFLDLREWLDSVDRELGITSYLISVGSKEAGPGVEANFYMCIVD